MRSTMTVHLRGLETGKGNLGSCTAWRDEKGPREKFDKIKIWLLRTVARLQPDFCPHAWHLVMQMDIDVVAENWQVHVSKLRGCFPQDGKTIHQTAPED